MYDLDWVPVRQGPIYCSPACGGKCKFSAFERANRKAQEMVAALGKGWVPDVWENCGWHFNAMKDELIRVHPGYGGGEVTPKTFTAFLLRWSSSGPTPRDAVELVLAEAEAEINGTLELLKRARR